MLADIKGPRLDFFGGENSLSHGSGYEPLRIYLTTEKKDSKRLENIFFSLRSHNIHILVLHSGNAPMQKLPSCYLRLNTWKRKKLSEIVVIKASKHLTLGTTVLVMNVHQWKFSSTPTLHVWRFAKKRHHVIFDLTQGSKQNFSGIAVIEKINYCTFEKQIFC